MKSPITGKKGENANVHWLKEQMNPYFFISMKDEPEHSPCWRRDWGHCGKTAD